MPQAHLVLAPHPLRPAPGLSVSPRFLTRIAGTMGAINANACRYWPLQAAPQLDFNRLHQPAYASAQLLGPFDDLSLHPLLTHRIM